MRHSSGYLPAITGSAHLDVAFVCTGNRFRSPLAAALLERSTEGLPVRIRSLGLLPLDGAPALPEAVELGRALGVDLSEHRARDLSEVGVEEVDLVLGFEQIHVSAAVVDGHAAINRTFTLPELVGLLQAVRDPFSQPNPVERARARIDHAHALRTSEPRNRSVAEVADPLGRPLSAQRRTADEIRELVSELTARLFD